MNTRSCSDSALSAATQSRRPSRKASLPENTAEYPAVFLVRIVALAMEALNTDRLKCAGETLPVSSNVCEILSCCEISPNCDANVTLQGGSSLLMASLTATTIFESWLRRLRVSIGTNFTSGSGDSSLGIKYSARLM